VLLAVDVIVRIRRRKDCSLLQDRRPASSAFWLDPGQESKRDMEFR
jgi:hypothetical protein